MKVRGLEEDRDRDQLLCVSHYMDPLKEEKNERRKIKAIERSFTQRFTQCIKVQFAQSFLNKRGEVRDGGTDFKYSKTMNGMNLNEKAQVLLGVSNIHSI